MIPDRYMRAVTAADATPVGVSEGGGESVERSGHRQGWSPIIATIRMNRGSVRRGSQMAYPRDQPEYSFR